MSNCFDCSRFHAKCKAACCGNLPIRKVVYDANKHKSTRSVKQEHEFNAPNGEKHVFPETHDGYCCFLGADYSCQIYEDRPECCAAYGTEEPAYMSCPWQDKDGNARSRQVTRALLRKEEKTRLKLIKDQKHGTR